jgi:hypothetical protein
MRKVVHTNKFFKEIKRLDDAHNKYNMGQVEDDLEVWSWYTHDCNDDEAKLRDDGLWEHVDGGRKYIFVWRYHPNYCYHGKPHYNHNEELEFMEKSETEKVLYTYKGYEFVWGWEDLDPPTWCVWGMKPGPRYFYLRKDGVELLCTDVKKYFREDVEAIFASAGIV